MRLSWDDAWLEVANVVAMRSLCVRDKVGTVIVSATNRIISTGYNGPPSGFEHNEHPCSQWCQRAKVSNPNEQWPVAPIAVDYSDCPSLHAEANALSVCDRLVREGGTIYVTSHVCFNCAKLIANSGLTTLHVSAVALPESRVQHRDPQKSYDFLERCGITVYVS